MSALRPTAVLTGLSLVATGLLLIPASPASAQTTFRPGDSLALADPAGDVELADVDADGDLDQIVSFPGRVELLIPSVAAVDVLLADGTGGFAAAARFTVPEAGFVAAGDLNGDGAADVVVAPPGALRVSVLLADRAGGLGAARTFGSGAGAPGSVELADMTGDGLLDIVVGSKPSAAVSVLPGNGDGTFAAPISSPAVGAVEALAVGDVDADGLLDVVVADRRGGRLRFLAGRGDGGFLPPIEALRLSLPDYLALADLDGNGTLDVVSGRRGEVGSASVVPALGDGTGRFSAVRVYFPLDLFSDISGIEVADVDADGRPDVALSLFGSSDSVVLLYGTGGGRLSGAVSVSEGSEPGAALAAGDVDADGDVDLVRVHLRSQVLVNSGQQPLTVRFADPVQTRSGERTSQLRAGDLDGDGNVDLVTGEDFTVLLGDGAGGLRPHFELPGLSGETQLADVDADGDLDALVYGGLVVRTLLNDGAARFTEVAQLVTQGYYTGPVEVADFDEDGVLDLAVSTSFEYPEAVQLARGNGDGSFTLSTDLFVGAGYAWSIVATDLDGDTHADVAIVTGSSEDRHTVLVAYGDGTGSFPRKAAYRAGPTYHYGLAAGDVTGDGVVDLVTPSSTIPGDGAGGFGRALVGPDNFTRDIALADSDGDGKLDRISGADLADGFQVVVQLGLGNGYFQPAVGFLAGPGPTGLAVADMDSDGLLDVMVANQGINAVSLLRNTTVPTPRDLAVQQFIPGVLIAPIGGTVRVKDTTVNVGDQAAPTSTTRYRISTTSAPGTGVTLAGQRVVPALGPGRLSRGSAEVVIPADTAPGPYYLMACADDRHVVSENDELNNCLVAATPVRIGPVEADLVVTSVVTYTPPVHPGGSFTAYDFVLNGGNQTAGASTSRAFLSTDGTVGGDIALTGHRDVPALAPGTSSFESQEYTVPAGTPAGSYRVGSCADTDDTVAEADETNNCLVSTFQVTVTSNG